MKELVISRDFVDLVTVPLDKASLSIGRSPRNDLALPEPTVSRHQCELVLSGDKWLMRDHSGKGTMVNGMRHKEIAINEDSNIELGAIHLRIRDMEDDSDTHVMDTGGGTSVMASSKGATGEGLTLVGRTSGKKVRFPLNGLVVNIGSDGSNDLVVEDSHVSGFHCRLFRKSDQDPWQISDLDSTNGTQVDGLMVGTARLNVGSVITLGKIHLAVKGGGKEEFSGFHDIISEDPEMEPIFNLIDLAASSEETVLITGETGTGKDLVANAIHRLSGRCTKPLITVNCSAFSRELVESELFGHEKGSFTGALEAKKGLFEAADNGTIFLDEIGELPLEIQAKLLRTLENGEVRPIGRNIPIHVNARVIAGTNRSIDNMVREGTFREDLYYRVNVIEIMVPPLRKRPTDIPLLARYFLDLYTKNTVPRAGRAKQVKKELSEAAIEKLCGYSYPGNVRELKHTITKAALSSTSEVIDADSIVFKAASLSDKLAEMKVFRKGKTLRNAEVEHIIETLEANKYNRTAAAKDLGIARGTLFRKIKEYNIPIKGD